jgi:hypothetical protein
VGYFPNIVLFTQGQIQRFTQQNQGTKGEKTGKSRKNGITSQEEVIRIKILVFLYSRFVLNEGLIIIKIYHVWKFTPRQLITAIE